MLSSGLVLDQNSDPVINMKESQSECACILQRLHILRSTVTPLQASQVSGIAWEFVRPAARITRQPSVSCMTSLPRIRQQSFKAVEKKTRISPVHIFQKEEKSFEECWGRHDFFPGLNSHISKFSSIVRVVFTSVILNHCPSRYS